MSRRVELYKSKNNWQECYMQDLIIDDVFRMFEPDGTPVNDGELFIVINMPILWTGTTWMVECEPIVGVISSE